MLDAITGKIPEHMYTLITNVIIIILLQYLGHEILIFIFCHIRLKCTCFTNGILNVNQPRVLRNIANTHRCAANKKVLFGFF